MDYAYNTSRAIPAYEENGDYFYYNRLINGNNYVTRKFNILNELENSYQKQHTSGLTVTANLRFNFNSWLNANAILSYSNSNAEIEGYWGEKTFHAAELRGSEYGELVPSNSLMPYGGELSHNETRNTSYTFRFQANANKYFGSTDKEEGIKFFSYAAKELSADKKISKFATKCLAILYLADGRAQEANDALKRGGVKDGEVYETISIYNDIAMGNEIQALGRTLRGIRLSKNPSRPKLTMPYQPNNTISSKL